MDYPITNVTQSRFSSNYHEIIAQIIKSSKVMS
jgi:hypothetical protein